MKKLLSFLVFSLTFATLSSNPIIPSDTMRIEGKLVLWLKVPGYEAGYEYGRLLGEPISEVMEDYVINQTFGGAYGYQMARNIFDKHFIYDQKYQYIAQGMLDGMEQNGVSIFSPTLGENLNFKDVLIANSIPDFTAFSEFGILGPGCSDLMSWGEATQNSNLSGELVICRNLDWDNDPLLIDNALMIIWGSAEGQRIITFGFTGLIGALSGFNESGIITFQNMGNHYMAPTGTEFYPVNLAQRDGLEAWDYNQDGVCSPRDVTDAVRAHHVSSTFIVNSAGPNNFETPAEILEIHNSIGEEIRTLEENLFELGTNLTSTNHFRRLMPPAYCYRYNRFVDSLENSNQISVHRNWSVLQAGGVSTNLQTIQYIPYQHLLRFSFAEIGTPAYQIEPTEILVDSLFSLVGIKDLTLNKENHIHIYPNPCDDETYVSIKCPDHGFFQLRVFNNSGRTVFRDEFDGIQGKTINRQINLKQRESGVYYCHVSMIKNGIKRLSETSKIVISR